VRPYPWVAVLSIVTAVGLGLADWFDPDAGRPSLFVLAAIIVAALLWHPRVQRARLASA
jgi:hypothetical protein